MLFRKVMLFLLFFVSLQTLADSIKKSDMNFLWEGTYALSPLKFKNKYRIATYLPVGTLLKVIGDRNIINKNKSKSFYKEVVTQDGGNYLVINSSLSKEPYNFTGLGKEDVVAHFDWSNCPSAGCKQEVLLKRGSVVALSSDGESATFLKSLGNNYIQDTISIKKDKVAELSSQGKVTIIDEKFPRYTDFIIKPVMSLGTQCHRVQKNVDVDAIKKEFKISSSISDYIPFISKILSIGGSFSSTDSTKIEFSEVIGGKGLSVQYFIISVKDHFELPIKERVFNVKVEYQCTNGNTPVYVRSIDIHEDENDLVYLTFDGIYPKSKLSSTLSSVHWQYEIYNNSNKNPYLTSINNSKEYLRVLNIWQNQIEDVSLSRLLMSTFNASCRGSKRRECTSIIKKYID